MLRNPAERGKVTVGRYLPLIMPGNHKWWSLLEACLSGLMQQDYRSQLCKREACAAEESQTNTLLSLSTRTVSTASLRGPGSAQLFGLTLMVVYCHMQIRTRCWRLWDYTPSTSRRSVPT